MLVQLDRSGKLEGLSGLIVGGFTDLKDTVIPFGQTVDALILDKVRPYGYPICFGFPTSHSGENYALKVGARYRLEVQTSGVSLDEL
jgi:muramoyltetrapeptide carboxypeptidase